MSIFQSQGSCEGLHRVCTIGQPEKESVNCGAVPECAAAFNEDGRTLRVKTHDWMGKGSQQQQKLFRLIETLNG